MRGLYAEAENKFEDKFEDKLQKMLQLFSAQYLRFDAFAHKMAGRLDEKKRQKEARSGDVTATDLDFNANENDVFIGDDDSDVDSDGLGTLTENISVSDIVASVLDSPPSNTTGLTAAAAPARGTRRALNRNHLDLDPTLLTADLGKVIQCLDEILARPPNSLVTTTSSSTTSSSISSSSSSSSSSTSSSASFPCLERIRKLFEPIMGFTRYVQLTSGTPPAKPCAWFVMSAGARRGMPCRQIALTNEDVCLQHLAIFNEYLQKEGFDRTKIIESVIALGVRKDLLKKKEGSSPIRTANEICIARKCEKPCKTGEERCSLHYSNWNRMRGRSMEKAVAAAALASRQNPLLVLPADTPAAPATLAAPVAPATRALPSTLAAPAADASSAPVGNSRIRKRLNSTDSSTDDDVDDVNFEKDDYSKFFADL